MSKWEYGGAYKNYDMTGEIKAGTGIVKVHDIFNPLPAFMKEADVIFSDPPCSEGNLSSFYTKADIQKTKFYDDFQKRFFECVDEISPKELFVEVFASNRDAFLQECKKRYKTVWRLQSYYYHNRKNECWVLFATNRNHQKMAGFLGGNDEEKIIELVCQYHDFECIGDLCMGRGLVGFYADKHWRKFVGTELNEKRLAVLLERIEKGKRAKKPS